MGVGTLEPHTADLSSASPLRVLRDYPVQCTFEQKLEAHVTSTLVSLSLINERATTPGSTEHPCPLDSARVNCSSERRVGNTLEAAPWSDGLLNRGFDGQFATLYFALLSVRN